MQSWKTIITSDILDQQYVKVKFAKMLEGQQIKRNVSCRPKQNIFVLSSAVYRPRDWNTQKYRTWSVFNVDRHLMPYVKGIIWTILTFCWPCISVYLSQYLTNLMHKICFTISFISCLYMFRAHVLIIRRSKLRYTASGIITPIGVMIPEAV